MLCLCFTTFSIILLFPLATSLPKEIIQNSEPLTLKKFVNRMIVQNFPDCSVSHFSFDRFSYWLFNGEFDTNFLHVTNLDDYEENLIAKSIINTTSSMSVSKFRVQKFHGHCLVHVVQFLPDVSEYSKIVEKILLVTKKHLNYYIFLDPVGRSSQMSGNSLNLEKFHTSVLQIKHKIVMFVKSASSKSSVEVKSIIEISTNCKYVNEGKLQILFSILTSESSEYKIPSAKELFPDFLTNFNGWLFTVSMPVIPGRIEPVKTADGYYYKRGMYKFFLDALSEKLNCTFKATVPISKGTGLRLKNGTWAGVIGDVFNGIADLGVITIITYPRHYFVDFSTYVEYVALTIVSGPPSRVFTWKTIFHPFALVTWVTITCSVAFFALISSLLPVQDQEIRSLLLDNNGKEDRKFSDFVQALRENIWGIRHSIKFVGSSLLEQTQKLPKIFSTRLVCFCWLLFSLNIGTIYKSKYFSLLTFPLMEKIPDSFEELALSTRYRKGLQYNAGAAYYFIKTSTNPTYMKIMKEMDLLPGETECYVKTLQGRFACIAWDVVAEYAINDHFSDEHGNSLLVVSNCEAFTSPLGITVRKSADFLEKINLFIRGALPGHLMEIWIKNDMQNVRSARIKSQKEQKMMKKNGITNNNNNSTRCNNKPAKPGAESSKTKTSVVALSLKHMSGPFSVFFVGFLVSSVRFSRELLVMLWNIWKNM